MHEHDKIETFLWGLLPDNEFVLGRWAQRFQVSARNVFSLISFVGEDCSGAVQFVRPERLGAVLAPIAPEIDWLEEADIAKRLNALKSDHAAWRMPRDTGQFSLAGAQPKTALFHDGQRWGVPAGRMPTTHILKPPSGEFDGHAENEHFCLSLARSLGLSAASSEVRWFGNEVAIVVERYDRVRGLDPLSILRLHQEDICQALGAPPTAKYQNEGGPGPEEIIRLLRSHSSQPPEDIARFIDALAYNWFIAGTDAHAKNYSLLHGGGGRVRLAPLYDLASALPYAELDPLRIKLAMKIGGEYRLRDIGARQWGKLANEVELDSAPILMRIGGMASDIAGKAAFVRRKIIEAGISHPILDRLVRIITSRAKRCAQLLRL
jgi:serine/threonine-protein kinase HipA